MYKITKEFNFESAHILQGHSGLCKNLHGHSYKLFVTIAAFKCVDGMIMDFAELKKIVLDAVICKVDHAFLSYKKSEDKAEKEIFDTLKKYGRRIYELDFLPTAENLAKHFFDILKPLVNSDLCRLDNIKLYETASSYCVYSEGDGI